MARTGVQLARGLSSIAASAYSGRLNECNRSDARSVRNSGLPSRACDAHHAATQIVHASNARSSTLVEESDALAAIAASALHARDSELVEISGDHILTPPGLPCRKWMSSREGVGC
jgi:hypothetical protein